MRMIALGLASNEAPCSGPHHPHAPLQSGVRLLQRIRRPLEAGADRNHVSSASTSWPNLGTNIITISGGEPLLHPELDR